MSGPLRIGVIGVGHLGRVHARIYSAIESATLVGVVDSDPLRSRAIANELGCEAFDHPTELIGRVDAVSVVVPTIAHADVAIPLLEAGIPCLVEKPLAINLEQADRILAAADRGRAALAVGHVERFQPGVRLVQELGLRPRFVECHRLSAFSFRSMDVGVVHDLMIHDLDLVLHLMGNEVEEIDVAGGGVLSDNADIASVRLVFSDGGRANVTASRVSLSPMRRFRMFSSQSYVSLDFTKNYGLLVRKGPEWDAGREEIRRMGSAELALRGDLVERGILEVEELELTGGERPLQAELASFIDAIRRSQSPEVTGEEGRRALALAERIASRIGSQTW